MGYRLNGSPLPLDEPFTDSEGTNYPANWLRLSTADQRAAVPTGGITWVADPPWYESRFYNGPNNPKPIADLKTEYIEKQKTTANTLLAKTDWLVVRKSELGTAVPSDTTTFRASVRTQCKAREDQVTACSDTDALSKLFHEPQTLPGTASNGATEEKYEVFDTSKEIKDGSGNSYSPKKYESFDPKQYASYDPKRYLGIPNPDRLKDWPTE